MLNLSIHIILTSRTKTSFLNYYHLRNQSKVIQLVMMPTNKVQIMHKIIENPSQALRHAAWPVDSTATKEESSKSRLVACMGYIHTFVCSK